MPDQAMQFPSVSPATTVAPPTVAPPLKKTQEDLNIEVYENVFKKCMEAAARITGAATHENRRNQIEVAKAMFDRFYNDQTAMKAGATQAKAMIDGLNQVLEGRR